MIKPTKLGFSLIELSIVILVIGILVIGITKGSRIIREAKLKSARALTSSSPAASTADLLMWLDTTAEKGFVAGTADGQTISTWYDINPQSIIKNDAVSGGGAIYTANGGNGLPVLSFNGTSNYLENGSIANSFSISKSFSAFVVFKLNDLSIQNSIIGARISPSANSDQWGLINAAGANSIRCGMYNGTSYFTSKSASFTDTAKYSIASITYDGATVRLYINGVEALGSNGSNTGGGTSGKFVIGRRPSDGAGYMNGYIGEVITFGRALKISERANIEQYLGTKWGIRI